MNAQTPQPSAPPGRIVRAAANLGLKAARHGLLRMKTGWKGVRYRSRWTPWGGAAWKLAAFARSPIESRRRRQLAAAFTARVACATMPAGKGYCLLQPDHFEDIDAVIETCRALFERKRQEAAAATEEGHLRARAVKSEYLRNLLSNDDLREHPLLVDFALSDAALGTAVKYLGTIPYLNRVDLLYSVPRPGDKNVSSQLFHVDPEGLTQVKYFINVFDVGEAEGPFTFLPADDTARVIREVAALRRKAGKPHAGRYLDDEIAAVGASGAVVRVTGRSGAGVAVDTSRCLHLGSRVEPDSFRLCLYLQYCTTREQGNVFDVDRYRGDRIRYHAVEHSLASKGSTLAAPHQMGMQ